MNELDFSSSRAFPVSIAAGSAAGACAARETFNHTGALEGSDVDRDHELAQGADCHPPELKMRASDRACSPLRRLHAAHASEGHAFGTVPWGLEAQRIVDRVRPSSPGISGSAASRGPAARHGGECSGKSRKRRHQEAASKATRVSSAPQRWHPWTTACPSVAWPGAADLTNIRLPQ
jgi:hypothetical protein